MDTSEVPSTSSTSEMNSSELPSRSSIFSKMDPSYFQSVRDGWPTQKERAGRICGTSFICELANRLLVSNEDRTKPPITVPTATVGVAIVYLHRFYAIHSMNDFDTRDVGATCLYLSNKMDEGSITLERIVRHWFAVKFQVATPPYKDRTCVDLLGHFAILECLLIETLEFDFEVLLPHPIVITHMELHNAPKPVRQCSFCLATDILRLTPWHLTQDLEDLACVVIKLAYELNDQELPKSLKRLKFWFYDISPSLTELKLNVLAGHFRSTLQTTFAKNLSIVKFAKAQGGVLEQKLRYWEPMKCHVGQQNRPLPSTPWSAVQRFNGGSAVQRMNGSMASSSFILEPPPKPPTF